MSIPKLSEAIILGAMLRPCVPTVVLEECGSCSLGAALEAQGFTPATRSRDGRCSFQHIQHLWPWTAQRIALAQWPVELSDEKRNFYHRNSDYIWQAISLMTIAWESRERVAAWVSTIEPAEPIAAPVAADTQEVAHVRT